MLGPTIGDSDKWVAGARAWILVSLLLIALGVATGRPLATSRVSLVSDIAIALTSSLVMLAMLVWARSIEKKQYLGVPVGAVARPESYSYALSLFIHAMLIGVLSVVADFLDTVLVGGFSWLLYIPDELSPPLLVLILVRVVYIVFYEVSDIGSPVFFRRVTTPIVIITSTIVAIGFMGAAAGFYGFKARINSFAEAVGAAAGLLGLSVAIHSISSLRRLRLRFFMADYIDIALSILVFYIGFNVLDILGNFLVFNTPAAPIGYHALKLILVVGGIFYSLLIASAAIDLFTSARAVIAESYEMQRSVVFEINTVDVTRAYSVIASYIRRLATRKRIDTVLIFGWRPPRLYHALHLILPGSTDIRFCSVVPSIAFPETKDGRCIVGPEASHILHIYLEEKGRGAPPDAEENGGGAARRVMIVIDGVSESLILAGLPKTIDMLGKILYNLEKGDVLAIIYDRGVVEAGSISPLRGLADTLIEVV